MKSYYKDFVLLYVEDDELVSSTLSEFLKRRFGKVIVAKDGEEGLLYYKENSPDIVITDINMPKMDGLSMAEAIKKIDKDAQIIVTTAYSSEDLFLRAIDVGISNYVLKPIDKDMLIKAIDASAQVVRLQREVLEKNREIDLLLNFQEDMVIVVDKKGIRAANRSFREFVYQVIGDEASLEAVKLGDMFLKEDGFIYDTPELSWLDMMVDLKESQKKVRIADKKGRVKTFILKYKNARRDDLFVVSFTDITDIEMEMFRIQREADTDKLTGIFNRNRFDRIVEREINHLKGTKKSTVLVMFDIDYFKKINDTYGHIVGDEVLKGLVRVVRKNIRFNDIFARWGGEEFVIMVPDISVKGAEILCNKLRGVIKHTKFAKTISLTCSFGITPLLESDTVKKAIERVDKALYEAKRNGRDRVEIAQISE